MQPPLTVAVTSPILYHRDGFEPFPFRYGSGFVLGRHEQVSAGARVLITGLPLTAYLLSRAMGQLFMMGFDGTEVTSQIQSLIEQHHLGTILLTAKNLIS